MSLTYAQFYLFYLLGNKNFWNVKKKRKRLSIRRMFMASQQLARGKFSAGIYLFKFNNEKTKTMCEICSKLTIKTAE